ncbi:Bax inhibitor-1 family protein [Dechloromonas sp. XY25]|uniref:Bax inhibitor-1 family protein n=1 Tax=Dechloromonas hankyongensis TaxID=2908002 RepID=A0ABS9K4W1_9RHOO|nr:Bax inhibitor-1 family protein [Dechloromonas hankyongensis]MCG2578109.1 Bax inhibitor-1 family protein [Dechloromonas hankyongensis]
MSTEARVIDLSKTDYRSYAVPDTNRVIRNTYQLLALSTGVAGVGAGISMWAGFGPLAGILFTLLGLVPLFYLHKKRNTAAAVPAMMAFTGLSGLGLGPTLSHYINMPGGSSTVLTAAVLTTVVTLALTAYVHKTGKDFTRMEGFLFAGLIVVLLASIAAIFIPAMHAGVSAVAALLFSGFILYDTSRLVRGEEDNYVMAAVSMYLNLLNLFLSLLQLLGISIDD